jgi:hypothetical protein
MQEREQAHCFLPGESVYVNLKYKIECRRERQERREGESTYRARAQTTNFKLQERSRGRRGDVQQEEQLKYVGESVRKMNQIRERKERTLKAVHIGELESATGSS